MTSNHTICIHEEQFIGQSRAIERISSELNYKKERLDELKNEFSYIHFDKKEMNKYPSPDLLDSLGYAFIGIKNIINNKTTE